METKEIVLLLTNKGYVAIESKQIFDLWKNKSLKVILEELHKRYPKYKIHLGHMDKIQFHQAVDISHQYLSGHNKLETLKSQNTNLKNHNKMKRLTFNAETAKTLAKVATGFTTQKVIGALHLTVQSGADVLQFGANTLAKGEAAVLTKLGLYNESNEELIKIRQERTEGYQELVKQTPKQILEASGVIRNRIENLIANRNIKTVNH